MVSDNKIGDSVEASPFFGKKERHSNSELVAQILTIKSPSI